MHGSVNAWVSECMGQNKLAALTEEAPFVGDIALKMRCTEAAGTHTHTSRRSPRPVQSNLNHRNTSHVLIC